MDGSLAGITFTFSFILGVARRYRYIGGREGGVKI